MVEGELQKRAQLQQQLQGLPTPAQVLLAIAQAKQHTQRARLGLRATKMLQLTFGFAALLRSRAVSHVRRRPGPAAYS